MLLAVSPTQTTLYDQIRYTGNPASFAWVLPIHGTVDVGLSADVLFDSVDALTATQIVAPAPELRPAAQLPWRDSASPRLRRRRRRRQAPATAVTVTKAENVGPYATVQLHSTDASALDSWLAQNGFSIPADVVPVIDQYVAEGFDFLAMKLLPNQGVQAMRPVRVTTPGASLSLAAAHGGRSGPAPRSGSRSGSSATGGTSRRTFPFFHIEDSDLVWDFSTSSSNYTTLRAAERGRCSAARGGRSRARSN